MADMNPYMPNMGDYPALDRGGKWKWRRCSVGLVLAWRLLAGPAYGCGLTIISVVSTGSLGSPIPMTVIDPALNTLLRA